MAGTPTNTLYDVMPRILATALQTLREEAAIVRLVNGDYSQQAAQRGSVIDVPVPTRIQAQEVEPGPYSQSLENLDIQTVPIPMNQWYEAPFSMTDKDILEVMAGVPNMQIQEAARAIANKVTESVYSMYIHAYNAVGTPGTTPLGSTTAEIIEGRKFLNRHLCPNSNRRIVLDVDAEANAVKLLDFQQADNGGLNIADTAIGRKLGFDWFYDQLAPYHNAGTVTAATGDDVLLAYQGGEPYVTQTVADNNSTGLVRFNARKQFYLTVDNVGAGSSVAVGDVFKVAGDNQTYVVKEDADVAGGVLTVRFEPEPVVTWADDAIVTFLGDHAVNLMFHRDAIALAMRPLQNPEFQQELGGNLVMTMQDPVTRIPLRLEVRREWKRVRWSLDALWGAAVIRPQHIVRVAG